ncbi:MAG: PilZ domain-containing protein [Parvularculaceae bacterium]
MKNVFDDVCDDVCSDKRRPARQAAGGDQKGQACRLRAETKKKTPEAPKNWRAEERHTTYKFAKVYSDPETALDCIILDMHAHGARLKLLGAPELPNIVVLVAPGIGLRAKSKVVWQNGEEAGLNFVNKGSPGEEPR